MYDSIKDIENATIAAKDSYPELEQLNSSSTTAVWRLWIKVFSGITFDFQTIIQKFKAEIDSSVKANQTGSLDWYVTQSLLFQYGDDLTFQNGVYAYQTIDLTKQIIKRASYSTELLSFGLGKINSVTLKVAKENSEGRAVPLDINEKAAFDLYISKLMFAGSYINTLSLPNDSLKIGITVYYNVAQEPILTKQKVIETLTNYVQNLPFNAAIKRNDIVLIIRNIVGVDDCKITLLEAKQSGGVYAEIDLTYTPLAGYIDFDEELDLETAVTMQAS